MEFIPTALDGVWIIDSARHGDLRGYFCETFRKAEFEAAVGHVDFVQENESMSRRGVLRGLHYQAGAAAQAKLVRVTRGAIIDVAVDLRRSSPTFGQHIAVELNAGNGRQLFVPRGFAHGFAVLEDNTVFQYKVDNYYCPAAERGISPFDSALGISWPFTAAEAVVSPKDSAAPPLSQAELFD